MKVKGGSVDSCRVCGREFLGTTSKWWCPYCGNEEEKMKVKVLWASRHLLDKDAEESLREFFPGEEVEIEATEILWPDDASSCYKLAYSLICEYDIIAGVFPAQAIEGFVSVLETEDGYIRLPKKIFSPVSVPVTEKDESKTRRFKFARWAIVL